MKQKKQKKHNHQDTKVPRDFLKKAPLPAKAGFHGFSSGDREFQRKNSEPPKLRLEIIFFLVSWYLGGLKLLRLSLLYPTHIY